MISATGIEFAAIDLGTSNVRAWGLDGAGRGAVNGDRDTRLFKEHLDTFMKSPASDAMTVLFHVRARNILRDVSRQMGRTRLSAILIGSEVKSGLKKYPASDVTIIGTEGISNLYRSAFSNAGVHAGLVDAADAPIAGLSTIRARERVH